jgi:acetyl-CoA C-acetyltransferase
MTLPIWLGALPMIMLAETVMDTIFVVGTARTAIGTFGGSLKDATPAFLGETVSRAAIARAGVDPTAVGQSVFGQVIPTEPADAYIARVIAVRAGMPHDSAALTVNRLCGSGLQAIISAAQSLMLGDSDIALAGGVEVMSRAPYFAPSVRWGQRLGDCTLVDGLNGALTDPFGKILMGVTAENVAERHGVTREVQDALAVESHRRATAAITAGHFRDQIVPIELEVRRKPIIFDRDEHVRWDASLDGMAALRPLFRASGSVTAGNSSGINDGAAALVLATEEAVMRDGLKPLARLVAYGVAGVDPAYMGMGPVPATRKALSRAGLSLASIDVIEANEAFASQACAVARELDFNSAKVNPNGSGISLGHPVGATGAIITVKLLAELQRIGGRYGLVTMCIGGGQGIAAIFERFEK